MNKSKEIVEYIEYNILEYLMNHNFKKKRKYKFIRKIKNGTQHIIVSENKIRGKDEIYMGILIGFNYENVNKLIAFIKNEKYDKEFATASLNLGYINGSNRPYACYINDTVDVQGILEDIKYNLNSFAFDYWDMCNDLEKFWNILQKKESVVLRSTLEPLRWCLLALSIILKKDYNKVIEEYYDEFNNEGFTKKDILNKIQQYHDNKMEL